MGILSRILDRLAGRAEGGAPARLPSRDELVLVARPNGEIEAQLLRQMLAAEGVHAMVKNRDAVSAESGGMGPPWAYELWVLRKDLRRAREIIGEDEQT
jgi:Putative prokaryotic signal transducing protein